MRIYLVLFITTFIINSCSNKSPTGPARQENLTLSRISWFTDTTRTETLIFGDVFLIIQGHTNGDLITVRTYGDGVTGNRPLTLDGNSDFHDTIPICFTHWATTDKFVKSTIIKIYRDSLPIDSTMLTSDSLRYYSPSKYSQLEDSIRLYRYRWQYKYIKAYHFRLGRACECTPDFAGPFHIYVNDYTIDSIYSFAANSALPDSQLANFRTIDNEYTNLLAMVWSEPFDMSITFDPQYGFPSACYYDPHSQTADDELSYVIDSFTVDSFRYTWAGP